MRVRVIVADQTEARFYDLSGLDAPLQSAGKIVDVEARSHDQELAPEQGRRGCDRALLGDSTRRVADVPRSANAEPRPRRDAAMRFARQIAAELDSAYRREGFDRTVLVAGPTFIGLLRSALSEPVRATLVAEVRKDLVHQDDSIVHAFVPPEAFR